MFEYNNFEKLLPSYLASAEKERLKKELIQFSYDSEGKEIRYNDFYLSSNPNNFFQSDLVREIRFPIWKDDDRVYIKKYTDAIILSNSCDISSSNKRNSNKKETIFAPLIDLSEYQIDLKKEGYNNSQIDTNIKNIRKQLVSNIFYLPSIDGKEYVAFLDRIFAFPTLELIEYEKNINDNRVASLSNFGYYLFILKISYHLCRLPEEQDRE